MSSIVSFVGDRVSKKLVVLVGLSLALPLIALAQQGQDAVYNSTGQVTNSPAFIDASMFASSVQSPNLCSVLNWVLNTQNHILTSAGGVIDARGLPGTTQTSMKCTASPWAGITSPPPSVILLPAQTITIPSTWILPNNTKLIGEGYGTTGGTVILACTTSSCPANFQAGTSMIQFGVQNCSPGPICAGGISVENLMLNGNVVNGVGQNIIGITNTTAQSSYVDHVTLFQILGTGLQIGAAGSGPYTNITFDSGSSALSTTSCLNINGANGTRGIRGVTCIAGTFATPAIYLDASNNSLEDIRIAGFEDGILVGSQAAAQSNVLFNIFGDTLPSRNIPGPVNVIHIVKSSNTVTDLSIMGVNNAGGSGTNTIADDLSSPGAPISDPYLAMYVLGKPLLNGSTVVGYSRFTTSPHAANWAVGATTPSGGCNANTAGSLFSNTIPTVNAKALYVCSFSAGKWLPVK